MEAIILSGGLGTRIRSIVSDVPKPMAPVRGRPFLSYILDYGIAQKIDHFVIATGYRHELIEEFFGSSYRGVEIAYSIEKSLLGTGGGILQACTKLKNPSAPCFVMNGDSFFPVQLEKLDKCYRTSGARLVIATHTVTDFSRYGLVKLDPNGRILGFSEKGINPEPNKTSAQINAGVYQLDPRVFLEMGFNAGDLFSFEMDFLPKVLKKEIPIFGFLESGLPFIDIGVPEDYLRAQKMDF